MGMLAYLSRTLPVAFAARFRRRDGGLVSRLHHRVWPTYVDLNGHMNQAAYAQVIELGRVDWVFRTGAWGRWRGRGVHPVVAEQHIVYRRELRPFARFCIDTRAVAVDGRLLRFEAHLLVGATVHARGETALLFVGPDGVVPAAEVRSLASGLLVDPLPIDGWRATG